MANFYTGAPRISTEYRDCSMPLAFDQHKGCGFRCLYCFAYYQRYSDAMSKNDYGKNIIKTINVQHVLNLLEGKNLHGTDLVYYNQFIKKKKVIQWGALGDPFCSYEKMRGTALPILKKINELQIPISFSTKATWFVNDERYMAIFKEHPENWHFKFSIITNDEQKAKMMEGGVPSPDERFKAMKKLSDLGIATTLRLRPYIIGLTDNEIEELIRKAKESGAISVSTEFFCLDIRASFSLKQRYKQMSKIIGMDIYKFYKKHSRAKGYLRLNKNLKKKYIDELKGLCDKYGLKLYVSDPDYKEISCHGSCCGLPQRAPFLNYCHSQLLELIVYMRDNQKKTISWDEYYKFFKDDFEWQKLIGSCGPHNFGNAKGHQVMKNVSMLDYNKNIWNNPNSEKSPFKYFNGLFKPVGIDANKNIIYQYENSNNNTK